MRCVALRRNGARAFQSSAVGDDVRAAIKNWTTRGKRDEWLKKVSPVNDELKVSRKHWLRIPRGRYASESKVFAREVKYVSDSQ